MPINAPITITTVTPATDELTTSAPHGLTTGDGFIAIYTPSGTIPGGLAAVTDYWAIVTGPTTLKLASSSSNAMTGTAVDITSTGSGLLQLLRGLPYRRPGISVAGVSQVKSADLNADWESMVALWNLLTGQAQSVFSGITLAGALSVGGAASVGGNLALTGRRTPGLEYSHNVGLVLLSGGAATKVNGNGGAGSATRIGLSTDTGIQVCPLVIPIGVLTGWSVSLYKSSAAGTISAKLFEGSSTGGGAGTATQIGATQTNNANNPGVISLGQTGLSFAMTAGREYWIEVTGGGTTGDNFYSYSAKVEA